jgi:hypothetical protein
MKEEMDMPGMASGPLSYLQRNILNGKEKIASNADSELLII